MAGCANGRLDQEQVSSTSWGVSVLFLHGAMVRLTYSDEAHSCLLWTMLNKMEVDFNVLIACSNACNLLAML